MDKMTFEKFQATKKECADLAAALGSENWEDAKHTPTGFIYLGSLYIENVLPHWPERARAEGRYYLILNRDEYITDDLELLERKLFDWAVAEGY